MRDGGLIDRLVRPSGLIDPDQLREALLSDETREAIARALFAKSCTYPPFVQWEHLRLAGQEPYLLKADAVARVLTEEAD